MAKKLGWFGERFCLLCAVLFSGVIFLQTLLTGVKGGKYTIFFLGGLLCMGALLALGHRLLTPFRGFPAALFALRFLIALAVILIFRAQPVQDFQTMYQAACQIASGSREYLSDPYFYNWAYQTGFAAYEAAVIRLFGTGLLPLQLLNALWMAGTGCLVYAVGKRFLTAENAMLVSLLYALYPGPYLLSGVLTNQHIAVFFYYLGVWLLVKGEKLSFPRAALAGVSVAVGNVMRPLGVIVVLAFLCWGAVRLLAGAEPGGRLREAGALVLAAAVYFGASAGFSRLAVLSGLNPEGLTNNLPLWKFVVGLNAEKSGLWSKEDYQAYYLLPAGEAEAAMKQAIRERLGAGPVGLARLAWKKSSLLWGDTESLFWGFGKVDGTLLGKALKALNYGDRGVFLLAMGLGIAGLVPRLKKGTGTNAVLLLAFLLCGYYAAHLAVEVQPRYRYFLGPALFLLAGTGLETDLRRLAERFRKKPDSGEK